MKPQQRWVSTGRAAEMVGVSRVTMWRYAESGKVEARQSPTGKWLIRLPVNGFGAANSHTPRQK